MRWDPIRRGYIPTIPQQLPTQTSVEHVQQETPYSYLQDTHHRDSAQRTYLEAQYPPPLQSQSENRKGPYSWEDEEGDNWDNQPQYSWNALLDNPYEDIPTPSSAAWERDMGDAPRDFRYHNRQQQGRQQGLYRANTRPSTRTTGRPYSHRGTRWTGPSPQYDSERSTQRRGKRAITAAVSQPSARARPTSAPTHSRPTTGSPATKFPAQSALEYRHESSAVTSIDPAPQYTVEFPPNTPERQGKGQHASTAKTSSGFSRGRRLPTVEHSPTRPGQKPAARSPAHSI